MCETEKRKISAKFFVTKQGKAHIYTNTIKGGLSYDKKSSEKNSLRCYVSDNVRLHGRYGTDRDSPDTKIVEPAYENISANSCSLKISGVNSVSSAVLHAKGSMYLHIKMELQKIKSGIYQTIETWTASRTGMVLTMEEERLINVLASYRLKVTFTAGSETVVYYDYP